MENILEIKDLHTYFYTNEEVIKAAEGVNLSIKKGEVLGLVGESASGKTVTALSIMRLIETPGRIVRGEIIFEGRDLLKIRSEEMRKLLGSRISIIFQEPQAALNPLYTIGFQIEEVLKEHEHAMTNNDRNKLALDLLRKVGIPNVKQRIKDYPHNLSGGQAQRAMIAMAISCKPSLLIADEPTTALDVTVQEQIMDLFRQLQRETGFTLLLITHNLALCSEIAGRIAVMYAGRIVELAQTEEILFNHLHPYTKALLSSLPPSNCFKGKLKVIEGDVSFGISKPDGCFFHPRCLIKEKLCTKEYPQFQEIKPGHWVSCFRVNTH